MSVTENLTVAASRRSQVVGWVRANPMLAFGAVAVVPIALIAILAPLLAPYPGDAGSATHPFSVLQAPSFAHLFGTDQVGRDILSRVIYGFRVSPLIAVTVLLIAGEVIGELKL